MYRIKGGYLDIWDKIANTNIISICVKQHFILFLVLLIKMNFQNPNNYENEDLFFITIPNRNILFL